jgi:hypothetical protein
MKGSMRYMVIMSLVAICAALTVAAGSRNGSSSGCYLVAPITTAFSALNVDALDDEGIWDGRAASASGAASVARTINEILFRVSGGAWRGHGYGRA